MMMKPIQVLWLLLLACPELTLTKLCKAGTHLSVEDNLCKPCEKGTYTKHDNSFKDCLPCEDCELGKMELKPCNATQNRECDCKPGMCYANGSREACVPCEGQARGPSRRESHTESGDLAPSGDPSRPQPTESVFPRSQTPPRNASLTRPSEKSNVTQKIVIGSLVFIVLLLLLRRCIIYLRKKNGFKHFQDFLKNMIPSWRKTLETPEDLDNGINESNSRNVNNDNFSLITEFSKNHDLENQAQAPVTTVPPHALGNTKQVLTGPGQSQRRRERLIPAKGTNGAESLQSFFIDFPKIVPLHSWEPLMLRLGLRVNEIDIIKAEYPSKEQQFYSMLMKWQNNKGMSASVNALLDALEAEGQKLAKEEIQNKLVKSGKFIYENDGPSSVVTSEEEEASKMTELPLLFYKVEREEELDPNPEETTRILPTPELEQ